MRGEVLSASHREVIRHTNIFSFFDSNTINVDWIFGLRMAVPIIPSLPKISTDPKIGT